MIKILTIKSELESAKKLQFEAWVPKKGEYLFANKFRPEDVIVRWGNSLPLYTDGEEWRLIEFPHVLNLSRNIRLNCDKCHSLQRLGRIVKTPQILNNTLKDGQKAVVRYFEHSHGKDFSIQTGPKKLGADFYATEFIETDTEFRVWFCGEAMFAARRVALTEADEQESPCRSNWGYRYCETTPKELKEQTLKAAQALGLEIGAADVLFKDGHYIFLELNSAPSIDTGRLKSFFNRNIVKLVQKKYPKLKI